MESNEIITYLKDAKKRTPVCVYVTTNQPIDFPNTETYGIQDKIIFGDWEDIYPVLESKKKDILQYHVESSCRYSACELFNPLSCHARIEPGAIIRDKVEIGERVVVMMGAIINIGASISDDTMIDMNAVVGGRAIIKKRCHIGAGSVIAGVIEPSSAKPVIIEDDVMIGANAVVLEGVHIGKHAVVGAGAIVLEDVEDNCVVAGCPAKVIKRKDKRTANKTSIQKDLRKL